MRKVSEWIRERPVLCGVGCLIMAFVGTHFFLNWRAERRWQAYALEARARGVKLTLAEFERPEIPDAENFAALPMMQAVFANGAKSPMELPLTDRPGSGDPVKGEPFPLDKWQAYFKQAGFISETTDSPPRDILQALDHYAPQFAEWSQWKTRPRCWFTLDLKAGAGMALPHLTLFLDAARLCSLRMRAHLALGNSAAAYDDFCDAFHAYHALVDEPVLVSGLVRIAVLSMIIDALDDTLADHDWNESNLQGIRGVLDSVAIWRDYTLAFSSERGFGNSAAEELLAMSPANRARKINSFLNNAFVPPSLPANSWIGALVPDRLIRDNQLRDNRYMDELLSRVRQDGTGFNPDAPTPSDADHLTQSQRWFFFLSVLSAPVFENVSRRYQLIATRFDQARIAIAVERFRIARGTIPGTIVELFPDFMAEVPHDIFTGNAMIYWRSEDGKFILYSVGPNRRDDGGATDPELSRQEQRDWIWRSRAPAFSQRNP
jgi:hypothetical protein